MSMTDWPSMAKNPNTPLYSIQNSVNKINRAIHDVEHNTSIMQERTNKFRKYLSQMKQHPYKNVKLTPNEILTLHEATACEDMGEKFFRNLVDKFLIDPNWRKEPKKSGFPKKSKFYVKKVA